MLHVAAQGDSAASIYFFGLIKMDINARDSRNCTPLHWACYSHAESALVYILAQNPDVDAQDDDGYTPLHLAVQKVDMLDSCRSVRALLIKGANKDLKDNAGKTAADHIE
jgi:ankyrin repeat protein